tara:strand:- start:1824 stop:3086 length:1263 start_codon:yes stop_codon:yes gene_type:complete
MGFDAKAFGAAFLTEIASGIKERTEEAKKFKEEERAKAERNLTIFQKRMAQKDAVMTYAQTLKNLGASPSQIMFYAKDGPAVLKSIHDIVVDKAKDYKTLTGKKLGETAINEIMDIPQGFEEAASKYKDMSEFLDAGYRLSKENDEFEQPENEEILSGNFLLGIMGVGAKERVRRKLETEKYIGDTTIGQLNRIAAQKDFTDVFGGEFARASLDPTRGPRILDGDEVSDILDLTEAEYARKTQGTKLTTNLTKFLQEETGKDDVSLIFPKIKIAVETGSQDAYNQLDEDQKRYFNTFNRKMRYDAFKEESKGMNLQPSEIAYFGKEYVDLFKEFSSTERGEGVDKEVAKDVFDPPQAKPVPQAAIDFLIQTGELDQFIAKYKVENLPRQGVPKRPAVNDFEIRAWDNLWGRYYNADGTLK